jgi:hypothetical protein
VRLGTIWNQLKQELMPDIEGVSPCSNPFVCVSNRERRNTTSVSHSLVTAAEILTQVAEARVRESEMGNSRNRFGATCVMKSAARYKPRPLRAAKLDAFKDMSLNGRRRRCRSAFRQACGRGIVHARQVCKGAPCDPPRPSFLGSMPAQLSFTAHRSFVFQ